MPHNCCRNIVTTFSGVCQPLKKIALFASDQLLSGPPQRRVEGAVSLDRRTPQCHVAAAGNTSFRKRADLSPQVDRIGYRTFGITRHPGRASRRIFGYDRASGRCSVGVGVEEGDVRRDELFVDAFVVVDDGDVFAPAFVDTPVAGMGEPLRVSVTIRRLIAGCSVANASNRASVSSCELLFTTIHSHSAAGKSCRTTDRSASTSAAERL